jgi:hypothetical protein
MMIKIRMRIENRFSNLSIRLSSLSSSGFYVGLARYGYLFLRSRMNFRKIRQRRKGFSTITGKRGLDNCGKNPKKADLAQQFPVFPAALPPAAAVEGELLRQGKNQPIPFSHHRLLRCYHLLFDKLF